MQADVLRLVHHAHATRAQFLKDTVVLNRNPEERVRSRHFLLKFVRAELLSKQCKGKSGGVSNGAIGTAVADNSSRVYRVR